MKLQYREVSLRAKKDEKPITTIGGRVWKELVFFLDGEEKIGLTAKDWLYFEQGGQWYKLDLRVLQPDKSQEIELQTRVIAKQTLEDKRSRRQARRRDRRLQKKLANSQAAVDYSEELQ